MQSETHNQRLRKDFNVASESVTGKRSKSLFYMRVINRKLTKLKGAIIKE